MTAEIIHGDCLDVLRGMSDASVDLVLTDIPYGEVNRDSGGLRLLDKGIADDETFAIDPFVDELVRVCRGSFYVFCGIEQVSALARRFQHNGLTIRHGVWEKTNPSPMNGEYLWLSGHENCVFARKAGATFTERCRAAIWRCPTAPSDRHPTEKPLALFERLVLASSKPGDVVLDPCAGSGTTGDACLRTGRRAILVERHAPFVDVIRKRLADSPLPLGMEVA